MDRLKRKSTTDEDEDEKQNSDMFVDPNQIKNLDRSSNTGSTRNTRADKTKESKIDPDNQNDIDKLVIETIDNFSEFEHNMGYSVKA